MRLLCARMLAESGVACALLAVAFVFVAPWFIRLYTLRKGGEIGDQARLDHLNGVYIRALSDEQLDGRYARWCGDGLELRRGEILILEDA